MFSDGSISFALSLDQIFPKKTPPSFEMETFPVLEKIDR